MEFHEKLQALRKQKGLTQAELADSLYVSRTAVSKWESGRGYPNIDSLKEISGFFCVSIDDLLSGDELTTTAQEDMQAAKPRLRIRIWGLLDCSVILLLFLPLFGQKTDGAVRAVSLLSLTGIQSYMKAAYFAAVLLPALFGVLTLFLPDSFHSLWAKHKNSASLILDSAAMLLLIISRQPYTASLMLLILAVKAFMLIKKP